MIRILHCVNDMRRAGLETMIMNYYRHIDRTKIQFDFLTHRPYKGDYDEEIESMGGHVYYAPRLYPQNFKKYFNWMKNFFKNHPEYKIVHSHIDSMSYLPLLAAKKAGIPIRIAHSHNTSIDKDFKFILKCYFRRKLNSVVTHRLACGEEAGNFLFFKKDFKVIPNAVDAEKFFYNPITRDEMRKELNVSNKFVIGHIGRMSYQKNHKFLISIFDEIQKIVPNSVLVLVGVGEKEKKIRQLVKRKKLTNKVVFLGNRNDVNRLYQAFDIFVLPSLFEGIPVVGVEAQFAGLPCVFSNKTPVEVKFNENVRFIDLKLDAKNWAKEVLVFKGMTQRNIISDNCYDINKTYKILEDYYASLLDKVR